MSEEKEKNTTGNSSKSPKTGKLLLIGGNEDKKKEMEILNILAEEAGAKNARIEIITTASSEPEQSGLAYEKAFEKIGVGYAQSMHIKTRLDADDARILDRIEKASAILFTGGDQLRITSIFGATPVAEALRRHYFDKGGFVAGSSAGAAALTETIITDGDPPMSLLKGTVSMSGGLGLLSGTIIDTHFLSRGRFGRLIQAVAGNPRLVGIGLGEDTGILVVGGRQFSVVGTGIVIVVDGRDIGFSSVPDVEVMEPFSVENLRFHVLSPGAGYDLL